MKKERTSPRIIQSLTELHRLLCVPEPEHPLVSMVNFEDISPERDALSSGLILDFYMIAIKKDFKGKVKYGQNYYDFDEGVLSFISPGQICYEDEPSERPLSGRMLLFHKDFIRNYPLGKNIKNFDFFSYASNEALHLSKKEEGMIESIMEDIEKEYKSVTDLYSQDVIISYIELILNYSNRFYNRQFITRKNATNDLLINLENLLSDYFTSDKVKELGLPTVQYLSDKLHLSPNYLSDMLRTLTGRNTQQHIHDKIIERAKEILVTTNTSVSEIAYQLGFEYPQSFSKLFKNKTNVSPLTFRSSFN